MITDGYFKNINLEGNSKKYTMRKLICKIFGHKIDYKKAGYSGQIECKICKEYTDIGAVDDNWLSIGYYTKMKIFFRLLKNDIQLKYFNKFSDFDDLPF